MRGADCPCDRADAATRGSPPGSGPHEGANGSGVVGRPPGGVERDGSCRAAARSRRARAVQSQAVRSVSLVERVRLGDVAVEVLALPVAWSRSAAARRRRSSSGGRRASSSAARRGCCAARSARSARPASIAMRNAPFLNGPRCGVVLRVPSGAIASERPCAERVDRRAQRLDRLLVVEAVDEHRAGEGIRRAEDRVPLAAPACRCRRSRGAAACRSPACRSPTGG